MYEGISSVRSISGSSSLRKSSVFDNDDIMSISSSSYCNFFNTFSGSHTTYVHSLYNTSSLWCNRTLDITMLINPSTPLNEVSIPKGLLNGNLFFSYSNRLGPLSGNI